MLTGWLAGGEGLVGSGINVDVEAVAGGIRSDGLISESSILGDGEGRA